MVVEEGFECCVCRSVRDGLSPSRASGKTHLLSALSSQKLLCAAAGEAPLILGLDPATGGMERYVGLEGKIDPGQKKMPKIYHMAVHPTRCARRAGDGGRERRGEGWERQGHVAGSGQVGSLAAVGGWGSCFGWRWCCDVRLTQIVLRGVLQAAPGG